MSPCSTAVFQRGQLRARASIEPVAPGIPQKIKGEYSAHDRQRRENNQMRSVKGMAARVVQHRAPARHRREYAETEKAARRFDEYCSCHADGGLDKDRLKNIGKQVAQHGPEIGSSHRANSQDEFKLLHFQDLSARQASVAGPPRDNQRKDDLSDARAEESRKRDSQRDAGKR